MLDGMQFPYYQESHIEYYALARLNKDQPVKTPTHLLTEENYWTLAYSKPEAFTWFLYNICGPDSFKQIMHEYYDAWKFKHPINGDMHEVFKKYMGDKTDWFFDQGMVTNQHLDYEIKKVNISGNELVLEIQNTGGVEAPLYIETYNAHGKKLDTYSFEPIVATGNINIPYSADVAWLAIDHNMSIPDVNLHNNYVKLKEGKKTPKPTRFNFFSSYENPFRKHVYFLPGFSVNFYDGAQLGLIVHNYGIVPKNTEWYILPMYAFQSVRPSFMGAVSHTHFFKRNHTDRFIFKTYGAMQSYNVSSGTPLWAFQLSPHLRFIWERRNIYSPLVHEVGIKNQFLVTQVDPSLQLNSRWKFLMQNLIYYKLNYKNRLWQIENTVSFEHVYDFGINYTNTPLSSFTPSLKLFNEFKINYTYFKGKSSIQLRVFAGTFLATPGMVTDTRFRLSGWRGIWDYAFNDYYVGRSEASGFLSQQVGHQDGDFKINTFVGQTNQWIITANLEWDVPMIYAGLYMDVGTYGGAGSYPGSQKFVYNGGLYLRTPDRIFQIYFPIIASSDITQSVALNTNTYWERIRFTLQLQNIKLIKNIRRLFI
jgi:hypothetical protein